MAISPATITRAEQNKLLKKHARLIFYVVRRYENRGVDRDDLLQIARCAFLTALARWNPDRGSLGMFAPYIMQGALRQAIAIENRQATISLDAPVADSEGTTRLMDTLPGPAPLPDACAVRHETRCLLHAAIEHLPTRMRAVVLMRFGSEGMTLEACGQRLHRTREACRLREVAALSRLRHMLPADLRPAHPAHHAHNPTARPTAD